MFQLDDKAGEIFDSIIDRTKAIHEKFFTHVQYSGFEKTLSNPDTGNNVKLTTDNLIFTQMVEKDQDIEAAYELVRERFQGILVPSVVDKYKTMY